MRLRPLHAVESFLPVRGHWEQCVFLETDKWLEFWQKAELILSLECHAMETRWPLW